MHMTMPRPPSLAVALIAFSIATTAHGSEIFTTNGVAINGYDPVAYFVDDQPVKGSDKFVAPYKGATFHFASADHRDAFVANPEKYAPQYGGYCAFGAAKGYKAETEPQAFSVVDNKLYLNYNDDVQTTWRKDIAGYVAKANASWDSVKTQPEP